MRINAVIMAGGKGTRISSISDQIPKPMIEICGKPLLERQLEWLVSQGIKEVFVTVGHLKNSIIDYFGDGRDFGIQVRYIEEKEPLGTMGGLHHVLEIIDDAPILVINGDIMLDIDLKRMHEFHVNKSADITLLTHPNNHPYDSALIETNEMGRLIKWNNKEDVLV